MKIRITVKKLLFMETTRLTLLRPVVYKGTNLLNNFPRLQFKRSEKFYYLVRFIEIRKVSFDLKLDTMWV